MTTSVCPKCGKRLADFNGVRQHLYHKHKIKTPKPKRDDDPSLAEIAIEATIKANSGEPLSDLEKSLIP